ncbi:MAG: PKD domain-containing protein, partial [Bacteroidia bacterium]|nr:PKD domain-containing protein [Bacteroidia bacterium]MDW8134471.1 PKD domain-containing protein [Bacteroidia bacterium]
RADFWAEARRVIPGTPVRFHAVAEGQPHIYQWDFGGGIADDPSSPCPTVTFSQPGSYSIQLIVENLSGRRDTLVQPNYIIVEDSIWPLPLKEGWERLPFPPRGFSIENLDAGQGGSRTWERWGSTITPRGAYGRSYYTLRMPFYTYSRYSERDYLLTPPLDFQVDTNYDIYLTFAVSYACLDWGDDISAPLEYSDTLRVWISPDGGGRWEILYEKEGRNLSSHPDGCIQRRGSLLGAMHMPDPNLWRTDTINLNRYRGIRGVRLRFEGICGYGNMLYLDDIQVDTVRRRVATDPSHLPAPSLSFTQNANGAPSLHIIHPQRLSLKIYDTSGKLLWKEDQFFQPGMHSICHPPLSQGVYFLTIQGENGEFHSVRFSYTY